MKFSRQFWKNLRKTVQKFQIILEKNCEGTWKTLWKYLGRSWKSVNGVSKHNPALCVKSRSQSGELPWLPVISQNLGAEQPREVQFAPAPNFWFILAFIYKKRCLNCHFKSMNLVKVVSGWIFELSWILLTLKLSLNKQENGEGGGS